MANPSRGAAGYRGGRPRSREIRVITLPQGARPHKRRFVKRGALPAEPLRKRHCPARILAGWPAGGPLAPSRGPALASRAIEHPYFLRRLPHSHAAPHDRRQAGLVVLCGAMFSSAVDSTIVNVALSPPMNLRQEPVDRAAHDLVLLRGVRDALEAEAHEQGLRSRDHGPFL